MIEVAKDTDLDRKIQSLIAQAFEFGQSCADDDIRNMNERGDSHVEYLRDKLNDAKDQLYLLMLERMQ